MFRIANRISVRMGRRWRTRVMLFGLSMIGTAAGISGCQTDARPEGGAAAAAAGAPTTRPDDPLAGIFGPAPVKSGTQLWSENCTRCHYARPPGYYSGAQWTLVMHHMRSRANLTGDEERKILAFLQAGATSD